MDSNIGGIMKKFLAVTMMLFFIVGLAACQQSDQTKKQSNTTPNSHQQHSVAPSNETQKKNENR
ncbi:MAG: hypothetical protein AB8Y49_03895 [Coxiella-like endosymbiont]